MDESTARDMYEELKEQANRGNTVAARCVQRFLEADIRGDSIVPVAEDLVAVARKFCEGIANCIDDAFRPPEAYLKDDLDKPVKDAGLTGRILREEAYKAGRVKDL